MFGVYARLLAEWNERMNLTTITRPDEVMEKHFWDSLSIIEAFDIPQDESVIDVGSGAGFPGVPLKIARPDIKLTLLDSLGKRVRFLEEVSSVLGFDDVNIIHGRAEEVAQECEFREKFGVATARAVAAMPVLAELCLPFVKPGGVFLALKGRESSQEISDAKAAVMALGGGEITMHSYTLPTVGKRNIYIIEKISQTPPKYPRKYAKITKSPLR